MERSKECPECRGRNLYTRQISAGGGYAPNYLQDLSSFWRAARFDVVLCQDCGLTRFFAPEEARKKLAQARKWTRVY